MVIARWELGSISQRNFKSKKRFKGEKTPALTGGLGMSCVLNPPLTEIIIPLIHELKDFTLFSAAAILRVHS